MRFLRWTGIGLAVLVVVLVGVGIAARFSDGPLGDYPLAIFPGGPLRAGELVEGPVPDWSFARDIELLELQFVDPASSRNTWLLVHEGKLYVPCGYMDSWWGRLYKQWPIDAMNDGRTVVRIAGKRYERQAVRVTDHELFWSLAKAVLEKYLPGEAEARSDELSSPESTGVWFFELAPRGGAASGTSSPGS